MKLSLLLTTTLIGAALFISGCASKNIEVSSSEFLQSKDGFEETGELQGTKTYIEPTADFTKYKNIYVAPIHVLSSTPEAELTAEQKKLIDQIQIYLTMRYKDIISKGSAYTLVDTKEHPDTLVYEGAISSITVEFDDLNGMNLMPMMLVGTMVARATYKDGNIRILGEGRILDAQTDKVLIQMMRLHKGKEISADEDELVFEDVKEVLDDWLIDSSRNLAKLHDGVIKHQKSRS